MKGSRNEAIRNLKRDQYRKIDLNEILKRSQIRSARDSGRGRGRNSNDPNLGNNLDRRRKDGRRRGLGREAAPGKDPARRTPAGSGHTRNMQVATKPSLGPDLKIIVIVNTRPSK